MRFATVLFSLVLAIAPLHAQVGKNQNVVQFTDTEAEARAWLDKRRIELAAAA